MSPSRSGSSGSSGGGRAAITALVVIAVAVGMVLLLRSRPGLQAFDPRSSAPDGANGAVLLLEKYGASVSITSTPPAVGADERVLVITDRLNDGQRRALLDFVDSGGVAVVADPISTLHGGPGLDGGAIAIGTASAATTAGQLGAADEANVPVGACTVPALDGLRGVFSPDGLLFPTAPDEARCFSEGTHAFVVVRHYGAGLVIGFGGNRVVTNQYLRYADNSGLLTSLLAPFGGSHVRVMLGAAAAPSPQDIGQGNETLVDLVRPGVWMALTQLALAFVVFCIARGVRPGRAVREPRPTPIAGNELVLATGNLMQRARHAERAGWQIRGELFRQLCAHFRLPSDTTIDQVSAIVGQRTGVDPGELFGLLNNEVVDAAGLVQLRADISRMRDRTITSAERTTEPV